eukprot:6192904-Pleurochrysis_carterae.AAC.4
MQACTSGCLWSCTFGMPPSAPLSKSYTLAHLRSRGRTEFVSKPLVRRRIVWRRRRRKAH